MKQSGRIFGAIIEDEASFISSLSCIECISQPFQGISLVVDDIESACRRRPIALQEYLRRDDETRLLGRRDAGRGAAMPLVRALAHFDETQHFSLLHDQIDFAAPAAKIALERGQALPHQVSARLVFGGLAEAALIGARAGDKLPWLFQ